MQSKRLPLMLGVSIILLLVMANVAGASTIQTLCTSTAWTNSTASPTQVVPPNPGWAAPFPCPTPSGWISYEQSGNPSSPGYVSPPNGTSVTFSSSINLLSSPTSVMLDFGADDTGELIIDGVAAVNFATGVGNTYSTCSDFMPGCDSATEVLNMNVTSFFSPGVNTVQIVDQQINGESYGVDATITAVTAAPEPATFSLIGCGLLAIGLGNKRKLFRRT